MLETVVLADPAKVKGRKGLVKIVAVPTNTIAFDPKLKNKGG
jgi:hypothetical protein